MNREDDNESPGDDEKLRTEPIHAAAPRDDDETSESPADATLPSDEPRILAEEESGKVVKICKSCMVSQRGGGSFCVDCGSELVPIRSVEDTCIGDVVGDKFTIVEKIGSGGMGDVYRGINEPIDQQVAIKFLNEKFTSDERIVLRFLNEARSYCKVNHPNAVTLLEYGQHDDGSLYLITEFIEGDDLTDVVRREGPLSTETITSVGVQMCEVLSAAHNQGIIHRDLKPDNLMLISGSRGRYAVKVLDFGIAKIADDDRTGPMTETGSVFGTPEFMSPEQARGETADPRSDLYALGAIMYYMATGKLPFRGKNKFTILNRQLNEDPTPPSQAADGVEVHPKLEAIILRCLEKVPEDRPNDADEVAEALEEIDWRSETPRRQDTAPIRRSEDDEERADGDSRDDAAGEEVLDGPAADGEPAGPLGVSTFDDGADAPLDVPIDDDDSNDGLDLRIDDEDVNPLGVTLRPDEKDEDRDRDWEDSLDTDAPDTRAELSALERQYISKRRSAVVGALATLIVLGAVLILARDGEEPVDEQSQDGLDVALTAAEDGRKAALLESTEELVDRGRFSEAESALEYFHGIADGESAHRDRYETIVQRASRAQNLEMRIRSHVDTRDCERAGTLLADLGDLSPGAADDQRETVEACTDRGSADTAEAQPSTPSPEPDPPAQPPPTEEPASPPEETSPPAAPPPPDGPDDGVAADEAAPTDDEADEPEDDHLAASPDEESVDDPPDSGDPAEEPETAPEEESDDTEAGEEEATTDDATDDEDEEDDVALPPSEI